MAPETVEDMDCYVDVASDPIDRVDDSNSAATFHAGQCISTIYAWLHDVSVMTGAQVGMPLN